MTLRKLGRIKEAKESDRYTKFLKSSNFITNKSRKFSDKLAYEKPKPIEHPLLYRAGMGMKMLLVFCVLWLKCFVQKIS